MERDNGTVDVTADIVMENAARLLKPGGTIYIVGREPRGGADPNRAAADTQDLVRAAVKSVSLFKGVIVIFAGLDLLRPFPGCVRTFGTGDILFKGEGSRGRSICSSGRQPCTSWIQRDARSWRRGPAESFDPVASCSLGASGFLGTGQLEAPGS